MSEPIETIELICPFCSQQLQIDPQYAGKWGRCRYCLADIRAPEHAYSIEEQLAVVQEASEQEPSLKSSVLLNIFLFLFGPLGWIVLLVLHLKKNANRDPLWSPSGHDHAAPPNWRFILSRLYISLLGRMIAIFIIVLVLTTLIGVVILFHNITH